MELFERFGLAGGLRWLHVLAGITWIGLLYYFNVVQVPVVRRVRRRGPGPQRVDQHPGPSGAGLVPVVGADDPRPRAS